MHRVLLPLEGSGLGVVGLDELIDGLADLPSMGEARSLEHGSGHDAEPDLDLVQPTGMGGREVEADVGMAFEPPVMFGLVCAQVVQDDMDLHVIGELGDDPHSATLAHGTRRRRALPLCLEDIDRTYVEWCRMSEIGVL